jgi:hypothetical protein
METFEGQVIEIVEDEELHWWQVMLRNEKTHVSLTTTDPEVKKTLEDAKEEKRNVTVTYEERGDNLAITSAE